MPKIHRQAMVVYEKIEWIFAARACGNLLVPHAKIA